MEAARRIVEERGAFMPEQFSNPCEPRRAHAIRPQPELLHAFEGRRSTCSLLRLGTGGTVSGVGRGAQGAQSRDVRVIAVEPAASPVLAGGPPGPTKIQGLNAGFIPEELSQRSSRRNHRGQR